MATTTPEKKVCILWIPTITHDVPKIQVSDFKKFRISDFERFPDPENNQKQMELWGEITPYKHKSEENLYDLKIIVYKNTDVKYLDSLHNRRKRQAKIDEMKIWSWIRKIITDINQYLIDSAIKKIKRRPTPTNLEEVYQFQMTHHHSSHNGMLCYTYEYIPPIHDAYNVFDEGSISHCIYHNIKNLFHSHNFHDPETDTILTPYCKNLNECEEIKDNLSKKESWETQIKAAICCYLQSFQKLFQPTQTAYNDNCKNSNNAFSLYGSCDWVFIICWIVLGLIFFFFGAYLTSIEHMTYMLPLIVLSPIWGYALWRWCNRAENNTFDQVLRLEGEYTYAKSLLISKYNDENNDECRVQLHNVKNNYMVAKACVEAIQQSANIKLIKASFFLSIIFLISELFVAYGLDNISTKTIHASERRINNTLSLKINPKYLNHKTSSYEQKKRGIDLFFETPSSPLTSKLILNHSNIAKTE